MLLSTSYITSYTIYNYNTAHTVLSQQNDPQDIDTLILTSMCCTTSYKKYKKVIQLAPNTSLPCSASHPICPGGDTGYHTPWVPHIIGGGRGNTYAMHRMKNDKQKERKNDRHT